MQSLFIILKSGGIMMKIENSVLVELDSSDIHFEILRIPKEMTDISDEAWQGLTLLSPDVEQILVEDGNPAFKSENNCLIDIENKTLALACKNSIIPTDDSVNIIGRCAFNGLDDLKSIEISENITDIGYMALAFCDLEEIVIPESVDNIEDLCFCLNAQTLKKITIKGKNTKIGNAAFGTYKELQSFEQTATMPESIANTLTVCAPADSYAARYAKEYDIDFEEI